MSYPRLEKRSRYVSVDDEHFIFKAACEKRTRDEEEAKSPVLAPIFGKAGVGAVTKFIKVLVVKLTKMLCVSLVPFLLDMIS